MLIGHTQDIINTCMNNLKNRIGFMQVFKDADPYRAYEINTTLVNQLGDYLKDKHEYNSDIGEDCSNLMVNTLYSFDEFKGMFETLKPQVLENLKLEFKDLVNNELKEKGPMD